MEKGEGRNKLISPISSHMEPSFCVVGRVVFWATCNISFYLEFKKIFFKSRVLNFIVWFDRWIVLKLSCKSLPLLSVLVFAFLKLSLIYLSLRTMRTIWLSAILSRDNIREHFWDKFLKGILYNGSSKWFNFKSNAQSIYRIVHFTGREWVVSSRLRYHCLFRFFSTIYKLNYAMDQSHRRYFWKWRW